MHFTREPIIETVITPRDGNRLVVRSSKGDREEYNVEALEVVSFNQALFFRSTERPSAFLLPVADYEVVETKEMKASLKVASADRSIRIGGGREASVRSPQREPQEETEEQLSGEREQQPERFDKKRDRRRRGRRREGQNEQQQSPREDSSTGETESVARTVDKETVEVAPSFISKLFPPPPTLIKETLSRYKIAEEEAPREEKASSEESVEQEEIFPELDEEETKGDE